VLVVRGWLGFVVSTFCCLCPDCTPAMVPTLQHPPHSVQYSRTPSPRPRRLCRYRSRTYLAPAAVGRRAAPVLPVAADRPVPAVRGLATDEPPPRTGAPPPVQLHQAAGGRERGALRGRRARRRRQATLGAVGRPGVWRRRSMPSLSRRRGARGGGRGERSKPVRPSDRGRVQRRREGSARAGTYGRRTAGGRRGACHTTPTIHRSCHIKKICLTVPARRSRRFIKASCSRRLLPTTVRAPQKRGCRCGATT